jgi:hypothetical protein
MGGFGARTLDPRRELEKTILKTAVKCSLPNKAGEQVLPGGSARVPPDAGVMSRRDHATVFARVDNESRSLS